MSFRDCGGRQCANSELGVENPVNWSCGSRSRSSQQRLRYSGVQLSGCANLGELFRPGHYDLGRERHGYCCSFRRRQHQCDFHRANHDKRLRRCRHFRRQHQFVTSHASPKRIHRARRTVFTATPTGTVQVNATNISTTGKFSTGIVAKGAHDVMVNVASGGSVNGGLAARPYQAARTLWSAGGRRHPELDRRHRDPDQ